MKQKIKVMQLMPEFGLAGAEIMAENLILSLYENLYYDVSVVSLYNYHSAITARLEDKNVPIFYLNKKRGIDLKIIFSLYKLFKNEKPDIIHTHRHIMPYAVIAAIMACIPARIHTIHNIATKEVGRKQSLINKFFYRYLKVIPVAISPIVKKSVMDLYKLSSEKVPMIYNGILLDKCISKRDHKSSKDKIVILHIGRFAEAKNHVGLIDSFKIVHDSFPNTELRLIGIGNLEELIKDKVEALNLKNSVVFLGLKENVYPYLNGADIFVLPSLWEGMPITLIEAMGSGLPIVATNVGGIPDMITNEVTGLIVNIDSQNIAAALNRLINDKKLREKLGKNAKLKANEFSAQTMMAEYSKLYKKTINNWSKKR